jgi:hypothetical protein
MRFVQRAFVFVLVRTISLVPFWILEVAMFRAILRRHFTPMRSSPRFALRQEIWNCAIATVQERSGTTGKVLFLEFGVYRGKSIQYFAAHITHPDSRFIGFDSFEGLPESWSNKRAGRFTTGSNIPVVEDGRISFVKGWFQDTLPGFSIDADGYDVVLAHMDADIYSSTLFVLSELWRRLSCFYVVFDEFSNDETRALYNFSQAFPVKIEFLAHDDATHPARVFCRITKSRIALSTEDR